MSSGPHFSGRVGEELEKILFHFLARGEKTPQTSQKGRCPETQPIVEAQRNHGFHGDSTGPSSHRTLFGCFFKPWWH